jgi:hypothetical protein
MTLLDLIGSDPQGLVALIARFPRQVIHHRIEIDRMSGYRRRYRTVKRDLLPSNRSDWILEMDHCVGVLSV